MPKKKPTMKTHKGYKKVTSKNKKNGIKIWQAGASHNTGAKPSKFNLRKKKARGMSDADQKRIKKMKI